MLILSPKIFTKTPGIDDLNKKQYEQKKKNTPGITFDQISGHLMAQFEGRRRRR